MALDWSKEISFSGLRRSGSKAQTAYPSKTYMNLMVRDKADVDVGKTIIAAVIAALAVALFTKFAVLDFLGQIDARQAVLSSERQTLSQVQSQLTDYDKVVAQYQAYEAVRVNDGEVAVNAVEALKMVDDVVAPVATVSSVNVAGNTLTLDLADVSLDTVGQIASELKTRDIVDGVSVSTASTAKTNADRATAAMIVTLRLPESQDPAASEQK